MGLFYSVCDSIFPRLHTTNLCCIRDGPSGRVWSSGAAGCRKKATTYTRHAMANLVIRRTIVQPLTDRHSVE
ncbi:hypothetical protein B0H19DRAFT_1104595 [Mycena capillaripes]|nr:hypothetical protein B0H19DRAFT_1104595 [Mycena capillaripes]